MQFQTDGLVVREMTVGESDRLIWVLTRDRGMIRAFARRAKIYKNSLHAATQLLCYGHFKVSENKDRCLIMEGQPIEIFFELRQDLTRLSLAQYFCELAGILAVDGQGAGEILRLVLNALHFLCKGARPPLILKAAVELRMLSIAGFMPDLVGCAECGAYTAQTMVFFPREGNLVCGNCHPPTGGIALSAGVLTAMRHIVYSDFEKLFSFTLGEDSQRQLARASERYVLGTLSQSLPALDFFHSLNG